MLGLLGFLSTQAGEAKASFAFELKLLGELGLAPDWQQSKLPPGTRLLVSAMSASSWPQLGRLRLSPAQEREIRQFLHGFLIYQFGGLPRGKKQSAGR
jgi:hypothetical protein